MTPLKITHYTLTSALGLGLESQRRALREERSGLRPCDFETARVPTWIGRVDGLESNALPAELARYECRNNRLARIGLEQDGFADAVRAAKERYGAKRIGLFLGTSTSGIHETELAYRRRDANGILPREFSYRYAHNVFSGADFVSRYLGLEGPVSMISTACSSSAKVFGIAWRHMRAGLCDAAVVGGVDSLCLTTLYGFSSLQVVSPDPCRPADAQRSGISIGEAAGFALLEWPQAGASGFGLLGYGDSSDAHHMSSPDPEGNGAALAMRRALQTAGLEASSVGYINLHGTATPANDIAEDKAVCQVFGTDTPCSSTKGWTGHALGAAGITEAVICLLALEHNRLPRSLNTRKQDPEIRGHILMESREAQLKYALSNSFGFGGNNSSLLLGRIA
nr:3-oxoacyl-[acyl-carrier-protein] synthase 2 [uncultured bacterium]